MPVPADGVIILIPLLCVETQFRHDGTWEDTQHDAVSECPPYRRSKLPCLEKKDSGRSRGSGGKVIESAACVNSPAHVTMTGGKP